MFSILPTDNIIPNAAAFHWPTCDLSNYKVHYELMKIALYYTNQITNYSNEPSLVDVSNIQYKGIPHSSIVVLVSSSIF